MSATLPTASRPFSFGCRYAVLNLDLMSILIDAAKGTAEGRTFISNCVRWNDAVHAKETRPLTIFTSLFSHQSQLELAVNENAPFTKLVRNFNATFEKGSRDVQIDPSFVVDEQDIVLQKTRWYAGMGNALEQILRAQNIDTVVIVRAWLIGYNPSC
jgi:nicotinamidase-related amidase